MRIATILAAALVTLAVGAQAQSVFMEDLTWPEIRDAMADVVTGSAKVAQLASNGADADVRTALHDVHERFEVVEHGCQPKH